MPFFGQSTSWDVELSPLGGILLPHHPDMEYLVDGHIIGGELSFSKRVDGSKDWHHRYLFPRWGLTLNAYELGSSFLGSAFSSRLFLDLPLTASRNFRLKISFGAGWVSNPFNLDENVRNSAIGSHLNASIGIESFYKFNISKKFSLQPGISLHHYSNGAWQMPNSGINLALFRVAALYKFSYHDIPELRYSTFTTKKTEIRIGLSGGAKEILPIGGRKYAVLNIFGIYQKRISAKSTFGGEIGLNYNESLQFKNDQSDIQGADSRDNYRPYLSAIYQLHFDPIAIRFGLGTYIAPRFTDDGFVFLRYHLLYELNKFQFFLGLKSHFAKADNIEVGTTFRIR